MPVLLLLPLFSSVFLSITWRLNRSNVSPGRAIPVCHMHSRPSGVGTPLSAASITPFTICKRGSPALHRSTPSVTRCSSYSPARAMSSVASGQEISQSRQSLLRLKASRRSSRNDGPDARACPVAAALAGDESQSSLLRNDVRQPLHHLNLPAPRATPSTIAGPSPSP